MTPPTGAENHGANTLPGRGTRRCKHPRARFDELQRAGLKTLQAACGVPKMTVERTCSPVQRPNFRGQAADDVEVTRAEGGTTPA
jgi:hypothetical protein